jgi:hypothetical protein
MSDINENEPQRQHHRLAAGYPLQSMKAGGKAAHHAAKHKAAPKAAPMRKAAGRSR